MDIPDVKPVKFKEFEVKQSKYEMVRNYIQEL